MELISDDSYISDKDAVVDRDEYKEVMKNIERMVAEALDYIDEHVEHVTGKTPIDTRRYQRR